MSHPDSIVELPDDAASAAKRPDGRSGRPSVVQVILFLLLLAAAGIVFWRWEQAASPMSAVDQFGKAVKNQDWKTVYGLISWRDYAGGPMDEQRFVSLAGFYSHLGMLLDYKVGTPSIDGERATVPVTVSAKVPSGLIDWKTVSGQTDVKCRLTHGEWKIVPSLQGGFLGLDKLAAGK
jgi:hypothetical protein